MRNESKRSSTQHRQHAAVVKQKNVSGLDSDHGDPGSQRKRRQNHACFSLNSSFVRMSPPPSCSAANIAQPNTGIFHQPQGSKFFTDPSMEIENVHSEAKLTHHNFPRASVRQIKFKSRYFATPKGAFCRTSRRSSWFALLRRGPTDTKRKLQALLCKRFIQKSHHRLCTFVLLCATQKSLTKFCSPCLSPKVLPFERQPPFLFKQTGQET